MLGGQCRPCIDSLLRPDNTRKKYLSPVAFSPLHSRQAGPTEGASRGVDKRDRLAVAGHGCNTHTQRRRSKPRGPVTTGSWHRALDVSAVPPCQRLGAVEAQSGG